jgi:hypothetical protein
VNEEATKPLVVARQNHELARDAIADVLIGIAGLVIFGRGWDPVLLFLGIGAGLLFGLSMLWFIRPRRLLERGLGPVPEDAEIRGFSFRPTAKLFAGGPVIGLLLGFATLTGLGIGLIVTALAAAVLPRTGPPVFLDAADRWPWQSRQLFVGCEGG